MAQVTMKNNVLRSEVVSGEATGKETVIFIVDDRFSHMIRKLKKNSV